MPQSLSKVIVHIVFSTKHRYPFIDEDIENELFAMIGGICREVKCNPIAIGGYLDHVHILCKLHRTISQAQLVKDIKTVSSKWMKTKGVKYEEFRWQNGYGMFSVDYRTIGNMVKYVRNQKAHHKGQVFKEEIRGILKTQDIDFDEKYVWD